MSILTTLEEIETWMTAPAAVRWGGEVVLTGFLTEDNPGVDYFHLKASGASVGSIGVGDRTALEDLVRAVSGVSNKPIIDRVFNLTRQAA